MPFYRHKKVIFVAKKLGNVWFSTVETIIKAKVSVICVVCLNIGHYGTGRYGTGHFVVYGGRYGILCF